MSIHVLVFPYAATTPARLDDFLMSVLPAELQNIQADTLISKSKVRRLIVAGAVSVGGQQIRNADRELKRGHSVVVRMDTAKFGFEKQPDDISFELTPARILFEDEHIIVVDKPAGLPTEATVVQTRDHLLAAVTRYLAKRDGIAEPYVGLHHRLDRETSGVILFSKQKSANPAIHKMFLEHTVQKSYEALVIRPPRIPAANFSVNNMIGRISPKSAAAKWGSVHQGGDVATTDFRLLEEHRNGLRILALPLTGRTHQIRVHLAGLGMPLLGDALYGGPSKIRGLNIPRIMLHAAILSFPHPATGKPMTVKAPLPADFQTCLAGL